jgi:hypothetical protein
MQTGERTKEETKKKKKKKKQCREACCLQRSTDTTRPGDKETKPLALFLKA